MGSIVSNNSRIARNTLMLYFRMFLMMGITFYTSRVVLQQLGVEDFGIYNVVGGVVAMFAFLNSAMTVSTQRYLTFELGTGNAEKLKLVFMTSIYCHALISLIVIVTIEIAGLWFIYNKMVIPDNRLDAALWTFQMSVASTVVVITSTPYNAAIIAHEKMSAFAYISVLEAALKLAIAFAISFGNFDKLIVYATLLFVAQLIIRFIYSAYCTRRFEETRLRRLFSKRLFREMSVFAGWNIWGTLAIVFKTQGLNLLLNLFFGPAVNAARGIAVQVQSAMALFAGNLQTAMNPQITKTYAQGALQEMHRLVFRSAKFTFFLLLILCLPVMFEIDWILEFWLGEVPAHTSNFVILMLCVTILNAIATPLRDSAAATGKVKVYQSVVSGLLLLTLPAAYLALKMGGSPESAFVTELVLFAMALLAQLVIIRPMIHISLRQFLLQVILPCAAVSATSTIIVATMKYIMPGIPPVVNCLAFALVVAIIAYCMGLTHVERCFVNAKIKSLILKLKLRQE